MMKKFFYYASAAAALATSYIIYDKTKPIKEEYIENKDGLKLFVKKSGKGDLCLYLHGGPGAWSKSFEKMGGEELEDFLQLLYLDQRGCGRSDKSPTKDYSLQSMMSDFDEVINKYAEKDEKIYILAHSFGGILAVNYAYLHPERVKGLILTTVTLNVLKSIKNQINFINSEINKDFEFDPKQNIRPQFQVAMREINKEGKRYKLLTENVSTFKKLNKINASEKTKFDFAFKVWDYPEYSRDLKPITREIKTPVLIINGDKDNSIGDDFLQMFDFPNSETHNLSGGHLLYYEMNRQFVRIIRDFVNNIKKKEKAEMDWKRQISALGV